eukprot:gene8903-9854_t
MEIALSSDQKQDVRDSWKKLLENMDGLEAGMSMFTRLFDEDSQLLQYFKFSKDSQNLQLKLHVRAVMATLDRCIKNLDNWDNVDENFQQLGAMHSSMGVQPDQVEKLARSFLWMMGNGLKDYYTENRKEACTLFIKNVENMLVKYM